MNSVVMIDFEGKPHRTLPKAVDFHPVTSRPIHVDFLRIGEHTKVHVAVPCASTMKTLRRASSAAACSTSFIHELEIVCDAAQHPERDPHPARWARRSAILIHISEVKLPDGVNPANMDEDFTVATIVAPSAMKAEEEEAAAAGEVPTVEGEEAAEGGEAEGGEEGGE